MASVTAQSSAFLDRQKRSIPTGASTLSKRSRNFVEGSCPTAFVRAEGCRLEDIDGRSFIDMGMALCAAGLGYAHPHVVQEVVRAHRMGNLAALPSASEVVAAERIMAHSPYDDVEAQVRFTNSGTEACLAAVRTARRATGKHWVLSSGYHGWAEAFMCLQPVTEGIPKQYHDMVKPFEWGSLDSLDYALRQTRRHFSHYYDCALVILEPFLFEQPPDHYLSDLIAMAHHAGALVCFDATVVGFRWAPAWTVGAVPDLLVYGKSLGNGEMPVACLVGPTDIMRCSDCISGSYMASNAACAAINAVLDIHENQDVCGHIWRVGDRLQRQINALAAVCDLPVRCEGMPPHLKLEWPDDPDGIKLSTLQEQLADRGVLCEVKGINPSLAHTDDDVLKIVGAFSEAFQSIQRGVTLRGLPRKPAFQREAKKTA